MRAAYIEHLTLTSGHLRRSQRGEVAPEAIAALLPLIEHALAGESVALSMLPVRGYTMTAATGGRCLIATVLAPPRTGDENPIMSCGVALHQRCGAKLWRVLTEPGIAPLAPGLVRPREPWVAAKLYPGIELARDALAWLGDFERSLAWAWLTRYEQAH